MRAQAVSILCLVFCGVTGAFYSSAAEVDAGADPDATRVLRAEEIVVETEMLTPAEVYLDTPVETEVLTSEEIRTLPAVNAIDALDAIPGIQTQSQVQGQRGAVRIDGLPPEYTEILVNGQRYSGENGEAIDLGDQLFANLDRIEVLRGPQALRYSPRAAGGVINIITKNPPEDGFATGGEAGAGDQDQAEAELTLGYGRYGYGAGLTYDFNQTGGFDSPNPTSDDPDDGLASPFGEGSRYRTHDVYSTFRARPLDVLEWTAHVGYRHRDDSFAIEDRPTESRRDVERWLATQELRYAPTDATQLIPTLTYSREETHSSVGRENELVDELIRLQLNLEHAREIGSTVHVLTLGGDLNRDRVQVDEGQVPGSIENPSLTLQDIDEHFTSGGVFAILQSEFTSWFESDLGVRYEMRTDFKPALLPQAALLFRPWRWDADRGIKIRISAGQAIRYPTLRELYQSPVPQLGGAYFLAGNESLDSEKVFATRVGIEANPKRWVSGSVVGFYSQTSNRIRSFFNGETIEVGTNVIPADPFRCNDLGQIEFCMDQIVPIEAAVFENGNLDDLESYGVEARLELRPHELIELQLGYTWNRTRVTDSNVDIDELPNSPRHTVSGRLRMTAPWIGTILTARAEWRDRALIENSGTGLLSFATGAESDTSFQLDFRVVQPLDALVHHRIDVFADLQNATDNRVIDSYVVRGRSFFVGLKWNFP
jgi:outer membrane receptor protein involved in Fe transport